MRPRLEPEPAREVLDAVGVRAAEPEPRLLYRVVGVALRAEDPIRDRALAALILSIGMINMFNRINVATRQVAGEWVASTEARAWVESHASSR